MTRGRPNPALKNWTPAPSWRDAIGAQTLEWSSWGKATAELTKLAAENAEPKVTPAADATLENLCCLRAVASDHAVRRDLGKEIWRARRRVKRELRQSALADACRTRRSPKPSRRTTHFNWERTFGADGDAAAQLSEYFASIYELDPRERAAERCAKAQSIASWRSALEHGAPALEIPPALVRKATSKLRVGKSSSDGLTAEILK